MTTFYENLLKATDNTESITHEKYATVTKVYDDNTCDLIEETNELQHEKAILPSNQGVREGDKVVIGFANNNIYDPFVIGVLYNPHQYHKITSNNNFICYANNFFVYIILQGTFDITTEWQEINDTTISEKYCPATNQIIFIEDTNAYAKLTNNGRILVKADEEDEIILTGSFMYPVKKLLGE